MGGMHPVQLGVVVVMTLCLGLVTPPYGLCLLIACGVAKAHVMEVFWTCGTLILIFLSIVALCVLVPGLTLWVPSVVLTDFRW